MTPDRAAAIFRELLQTPASELDHFGRRNGLPGHPDRGALEQAQELLRALSVALESGPGPNWQRINDAWGSMIAKHGKVNMRAAGPAPPQWIRDMPAKPTLGDPAPGTGAQQHQDQQRQRFVPAAHPQMVRPQLAGAGQAPPPAAPLPPVAPAPAPQWPARSRGSYPPPPQPGQSRPGWQQSQQAAPVGEAYSLGGPPAAVTYPPAPVAPAAGYGGQPAAQPQYAPPAQQAAPQGQPVGQGYAASGYAAPQQMGASGQGMPAPAHAAPPPARRPPPPPRRSEQPSAPSPQLLSLQQNVSTYAAFCAACANYPERVADTQRDYGVASAAARQHIDELWADRFDDDSSLHEQWEQLFAQFRQQLRR